MLSEVPLRDCDPCWGRDTPEHLWLWKAHAGTGTALRNRSARRPWARAGAHGGAAGVRGPVLEQSSSRKR